MSESQSSSHHTSSHHTSSHHGETSKTSEHSSTAIVTEHQHEQPATKPVEVLTSKPSKTKSPHEHVSEQSEPDQKVTGKTNKVTSKANKVTSKANKVTNKPTDANNGHVTDDSRKTWTFSNLTEGPRDYLHSKSYILLKKVHSG